MDYRIVALLLVMMSSALGEPRPGLSWPDCPCPKIMHPNNAPSVQPLSQSTLEKMYNFEEIILIYKLCLDYGQDLAVTDLVARRSSSASMRPRCARRAADFCSSLRTSTSFSLEYRFSINDATSLSWNDDRKLVIYLKEAEI
ncbi:hypothetical protein RR48_10565 [Papilio machaon]|uniref:Uncharacterized protein n=1 Tax=Papilio machaon TaxID=76193 RepID=A0A194RRF2_PAPMA|nr:hypothetical protein RR48_10565 [Papilio machaon]